MTTKMLRSCDNPSNGSSNAHANRIRGQVYHAALALLIFGGFAHAQKLPLGRIPPGKTFLIIQAHHDDHTWEAAFGGMAARLVDEGFTGYFVRTTNDEKDGPPTWGRNDQINNKESHDAARHLGLKDVISLNWRNDHMDSVPLREVRANYILLIRKLRPDIVMTFDPWGHYDRNPDHRKVARAAGEATWMAGLANVHPEHLDAGLQPHRVPYVYYFQRADYGRGHTPNVAIEINAAQVSRKAAAWWAHQNVRGGAGQAQNIKKQLADRGMTIPELDGVSDEKATELLNRWEMEWGSREVGKLAGVPFAEKAYFRDEWDHLPGLKDYLASEVRGK
ncbi:MAG: PIG-L family deacetylase [Bryobacteraceae bacterium]